MEMQGGDGNFLSDILLNGEDGTVAGLDDMTFGFTQDTQAHEEVQAGRSTKGAKRTKNFHWKEDEIICSGWLNVSKDPIFIKHSIQTNRLKQVDLQFSIRGQHKVNLH
jgi:hypothetical protein